MAIQEKIYNAVIYVRLSKEDGDLSDAVKVESNSISNQKELIKDFLKNKEDIRIVSERVDDGYSGVNFERPAFQLMLEDIKAGKVNCVIVKDLSRFGRNYIESGRYLENIFPMLGVRFIAINDNYDSLTGKSQTDEIIIPFKNLMNDAYCRDISIKIRSHLEVKRKSGQFISPFTVYGYLKDENNKNKIVVDEYAARIVESIFNWKLAGMSQQAIADRLNESGVLSPAEYKKSIGSRYKAQFQTYARAKWTAVAVRRILTNEIYVGNLVQGKITTPNYKVKKVIQKSPEEWVRVEDNHEAIITKDVFDTVQDILLMDTRTSPDMDAVYTLSGIAVCGDCGKPMTRKSSTVGGKKYIYYMCSANKKNKICTSHRIREDLLEESIIEAIKVYAVKLDSLERLLKFIDAMPMKQADIKKLDHRIVKMQEEAEKCERLKTAIYEDYRDELLSKNEYLHMKKEFENRRKDALDAVVQIQKEIEYAVNNKGKRHEWIEYFREYRNIKTLNRTVAVELISEVQVFEDNRITVVFKNADKYEQSMAFAENVMKTLDEKEKENFRREAV